MSVFIKPTEVRTIFNSFQSIRNFCLLNKCTSYVSQYASRITHRKPKNVFHRKSQQFNSLLM